MARVGLGHFPLLCSGSLSTTPIGAGTVVDTQLGRNHLLYHSSVRPRVARFDPFSWLTPFHGPLFMALFSWPSFHGPFHGPLFMARVQEALWQGITHVMLIPMW